MSDRVKKHKNVTKSFFYFILIYVVNEPFDIFTIVDMSNRHLQNHVMQYIEYYILVLKLNFILAKMNSKISFEQAIDV